ncbi:MAG: DUF2780 domain-containing protein [Calditrichaceae bacterium]
MTELLTSLVSELGIDKSKAESGLGALLNTVKQNAPSDTFSSISSAIPGAGDLLTGFLNTQGKSSGGLFGGLSKMAGGLLGGQSAQFSSMIDNFSKAGFSMSMVKKFLPVVFTYLQKNVSAETLEKVAGAIPGLDSLLGGSKSGGLLGKLTKFI